MVTTDAPRATAHTRSGYVTLVGRPNVGKSTLLNALVDTRLSIVSRKAQTTWQRVTGIRTLGSTQMIFLDTPGILTPRDLMQRSMLGAALGALGEADVVLLVVDVGGEAEPEATEIHSTLAQAPSEAPLLVALNKIDVATDQRVDAYATWARDELNGCPFRISALHGHGIEPLLSALARALPESPFLYPEGDVAAQPVRFFVAELVRETVFEQFHQEIPYSVHCRIEEFREDQEPIYIGAEVLVERESQKGILVGKGGGAIKRLGRVSREKIEDFVGQPVYLDLWVKLLPAWRRERNHLTRLGYQVPDDNDAALR